MEDTTGIGIAAEGCGRDAVLARACPSYHTYAAETPMNLLYRACSVDPSVHAASIGGDEVATSVEEDVEVVEAANVLLAMKHCPWVPLLLDCNRTRVSVEGRGSSRINTPTRPINALLESHGAAVKYPFRYSTPLDELEDTSDKASLGSAATMSTDGTRAYDSDETIADAIDRSDQTSPTIDQETLTENTLGEVSQSSAGPSTQGTRRSSRRRMAPSERKSEKKRLTYQQQCERDRERQAAERARSKAKSDAFDAKTYKWYMEQSGGDYGKALALYWEREERKAREPWPELEKGSEFVENMKRQGLDPQAAQQQDDDADQVPTKPVRVKQRRVKTKRTETSTALAVGPKQPASATEQTCHKPRGQELRPSPVFNDELRMSPTASSPEPNSRSVASGKQPASPTAPRHGRIPGTSSKAALQPPSQSTTPDLSGAPAKKRRRTAAENLESDLGDKWRIRISEDGRRPCVRNNNHAG